MCQDFKIQNIVGSCDVKFPIRLEGLAYSHGAFSSVCPMMAYFNITVILLPFLSPFLDNDIFHLFYSTNQNSFLGLSIGWNNQRLFFWFLFQARLFWLEQRLVVISCTCLIIPAFASLFPSFHAPLFVGERGDLHCLWKHLSCTDRV